MGGVLKSAVSTAPFPGCLRSDDGLMPCMIPTCCPCFVALVTLYDSKSVVECDFWQCSRLPRAQEALEAYISEWMQSAVSSQGVAST